METNKIYTSTLHPPRKKWSFKEDRSNNPMIHFDPRFWEKISALPPRTQKREEFWNSTKIRKLPETRRFQDLRFFAGFCVFFGGFLSGFAVFFLSRLKRCRHFLAFVSPSPKTCNQSPKIEDQSSI